MSGVNWYKKFGSKCEMQLGVNGPIVWPCPSFELDIPDSTCFVVYPGIKQLFFRMLLKDFLQSFISSVLLMFVYLQVVERIPLDKLSREECNQLLLKKGFYRKTTKDEDVPEEYRTGPYREREEL